MDIPYVKGIVARQAHVAIPDGTHEEEFGRNGFFGRYAHLYRAHSPVDWIRIEGPLKPRAYDLKRIEERSDYLAGRRVVLANEDVAIAFSRLNSAMNYFFRNADSDELLFVHRGFGRLETEFGPLNYREGDYLVIPRGVSYRLEPGSRSNFFIVESASEFEFPDRGMLGQHALFDPAVIHVPSPDDGIMSTLGLRDEYELRIKRCGEFTNVYYPFCPLDALGWKGTLAVMQLNVKDIRPVLSERYHLPPSAHTTFVAKNFVVCSFLPRPLETGDKAAMKVPFFHSNIDFDEVIFYHDGEFFSRAGIEAGMLTFHPQGIHHGPHKKAVERSQNATRTEEVAVMVDTKRPLRVVNGEELEQRDYWKSWQS